jgi:hypothetical protein
MVRHCLGRWLRERMGRLGHRAVMHQDCLFYAERQEMMTVSDNPPGGPGAHHGLPPPACEISPDHPCGHPAASGRPARARTFIGLVKRLTAEAP